MSSEIHSTSRDGKSGGGGHGLHHHRFSPVTGQMLLNGGKLDGKTYLSPATFATMTTDHIGGGSGVARDYFYYPGDGFGFRLRFSVSAPIPAMRCRRPPGLARRDQMGTAPTGVYLVVDRAEDMFFVVMQGFRHPGGCMSSPRSRKIILRRAREMMPQKPDQSDQAVAAPVRIIALRPRAAHVHHAVGGRAPLRRQLHPFRQRRPDALARLRSRRAVQWTASSWPACSSSPACFVRDSLAREGTRKLHRQPRLSAGGAVLDLDLRADADCLLSDVPALPFAGNDGFQFLPFLVAHASPSGRGPRAPPGFCGCCWRWM